MGTVGSFLKAKKLSTAAEADASGQKTTARTPTLEQDKNEIQVASSPEEKEKIVSNQPIAHEKVHDTMADKIAKMKAVLEGNTQIKCLSNVKIVRIFTSSTFTDTKFERNALMTRVYPRLKDFCKSKGYEFQVVDMRWGVRDESTADHMTTELCMQELKACQELSTGPSFVTFLGQKYGYRPFPAKILATEFESLLEAVPNQEDKDLLQLWFYLDKNSVPPVYILQPITVHLPFFNDNENYDKRKEDRGKWWTQFERMQVVLRQAALKNLSKDDAQKYLISVTEDEIHNGILRADEPNKHCLWFRRHITNLEEQAQNSRNVGRFYIDMLGENLDKEAVDLLKELKEARVEKTLDSANIIDYNINWDVEKGMDPSSFPEHEKYIERLCSDFEDRLVDNIKDGINERVQLEVKDPLYEEVVQHISTCQEKCDLFHGRAQELAKIEEYLLNEDQIPFVVHGESGCGKTSLVAMAARRADLRSGSQRPFVVIRFLGTTQQSSNICTVLYSVCQQICRIYDSDPTEVPEDYNQLTKYFGEILGKATGQKPLALFLDSLDQLSEDYGARQLAWLPLRLPKQVKIVVSTLPGEVFHCFPVLQNALPQEKSFVEVKELPNTDATNIIDKWLEDGGRCLTSAQKQLVQTVFQSCSLALFVKLTFDEVYRWKSYTSEDECVLQSTVRAAINSVLERLEYRHGNLLVSHALGYMTQSKNGVSDTEMEDMLSLDDDVLNDVYQYWTPPSRRLPPLLWIRIKTELGSYIVSRGADGVRVNTWYHRQFIETARERYLANEDQVKKISKSMGEYFLGNWAEKEKPYQDKNGNDLKADRLVAKQPLVYARKQSGDDTEKDQADLEETVYNLRKFSELPHSLICADMLDTLKSVLCDYHWLYNKLLATSFRDVIADFNAASDVYPDEEELVMIRETLQLSTSALAQDPAQLASQLVGRLLNKLNEPGNENMKYARRLVFEQARNPPVPALLPDKVCLTENGGAILHTITSHTSFTSVYLTRDKKRFFSASYDGSLKIFDSRYGYVIRSTEGLEKMTKHFKVDPSEEIAVTSSGGVIQVWKVNTGQLLHTFQSSWNIAPITMINDDIVAVLEGRLDVMNYRTGVKGTSFQDPQLELSAHWHRCCIVSPSSGDLVAYSRDKENSVNIVNYKTSELIKVIDVPDVQAVDTMAMTSTNLLYAVAYEPSPIVCFEFPTGEKMRKVAGGQEVHMTATLAVTPNDRFLAINMYEHAAVWDLVQDKEIYHVLHPCPLNKISLGSDGHLLVTGGFDYLIRVWDLRRVSDVKPKPRTIDSFVAPSRFVEEPNGRYSVLQSFFGYLSVWDNMTGSMVKHISANINQTIMIDDRTALICMNDQLKILDLTSGVVTRSLHGKCSYDNGKEKRVLEPALLDQKRVLVASKGRHHLKIMDLVTGKLIETLKADSGLIESLLVSQDSSTAVCLTDSDNAVRWDLRDKTHKLIPGLRKKGGFIHAQNTDISDDGAHLVNIDDTSGRRELARVYDLREARVKFTLTTNDSQLHCVAIVTATQRVLTGTDTYCVSIWDLDTGHALYHLGGYQYPIHSFTVSRDGQRVLTSSLVTGEQSMRAYAISEEVLLAAFTPDRSWSSTWHTDSKVVLCKPSSADIVKFSLRSSAHQEEVACAQQQEIDWGKQLMVSINDVTTFVDDGDDDN